MAEKTFAAVAKQACGETQVGCYLGVAFRECHRDVTTKGCSGPTDKNRAVFCLWQCLYGYLSISKPFRDLHILSYLVPCLFAFGQSPNLGRKLKIADKFGTVRRRGSFLRADSTQCKDVSEESVNLGNCRETLPSFAFHGTMSLINLHFK